MKGKTLKKSEGRKNRVDTSRKKSEREIKSAEQRCEGHLESASSFFFSFFHPRALLLLSMRSFSLNERSLEEEERHVTRKREQFFLQTTQQRITSASAFISYVSLTICRVFFSSSSGRRSSRSCKNKDFAARMLRRAKKSSEKEEERVGIVGFEQRRRTGKILDEE